MAHDARPPLSSLQIGDADFVVCDVETTGLSPQHNRLTEIALVRVAGGNIVDTFTSLINPRQFITHEITQLTGITNEMVYSAPEAEEVLQSAAPLLEKSIFVGHNARFDKGFLDATLAREGLQPLDTPMLCTARLARRLAPNLKRKSLGSLANAFGINIRNRHRAFGDAEATARVLLEFLRILEEEFEITEVGELLSFQNKPVFRVTGPPKNYHKVRDNIAALPHSPGVYCFHDRHGRIIYVGKAKSLKERVSSYFQHNIGHTEKIRRLVRSIHALTWKTTETELSALLLESRTIKEHQPDFNSQLKQYRKYPFIRLGIEDEWPAISWSYEIEDDGAEYFGPFSSRWLVEEAIKNLSSIFHLRECEGQLNVAAKNSPCLYYHIKRCSGPCAALVDKKEYDTEVAAVGAFLCGRYEEALDSLSERMERRAEEMKFEEAAALRDRLFTLKRIVKQQSLMVRSIRRQNLIILTPARRTFVELHFIKSGMLAKQMLVDQKNMHIPTLREAVNEVYYSGQEELFGAGKEDINEMRIIAQWCLSRRGESVVIDTSGYARKQALLSATAAALAKVGKPDPALQAAAS